MTIGQMLKTSGDINRDLMEVTEFLSSLSHHDVNEEVIANLGVATANILGGVENKWKRCPCCGEPYWKTCCSTPSIYSL